MKITDRIGAAWRAFKGQRGDPYAGVYGTGSSGGFAGGAVNRLTAGLASWSGSINADLDASLPILRARARSLAANNEHGRRFLSLVAANVVGRQNPKLQVRALQQNGILDKAANDAIETHWDRWGRGADLTGRHKSLYSLLRTAVKGVARDGEALIRIVRDRRLPYGMALQLLEADRLDDAMNIKLANGNVVRQGVELDSALRAVAYYVRTAHPGDHALQIGSNTVERVPAADMVHLFLPERAEQVRGVTWLHAVIVRASVIHSFEEAAVIAAQVGASKIAALERSDEAGDMTMQDGTAGGMPQIKVEAGEMFELPAGYKLASWNPEYPHANFESFLKACLRGLAAGLDVAAHNLTGDMTDVNYSSARIAELAEREAWMILQDWLIGALLVPVFEEWLALSLLSGRITFEQSGKALPADKFDKFVRAYRFQGRRWAWVDPAKEADAQEKLLANKLTSRTRICAEQGEEFDDIVTELAAEDALIGAAGLKPAAPAAPAPDNSVKDAALALMARSAQPAPAAPAITVAPVIHTPDVRADIHVAPPQVDVAAPEVRVEVAAPAVTVEPAAVEVRVEAVMPEQAAPVVEVNVDLPDEMKITALPARETVSTVERDGAGNITRTAQREQDA